jgi:hypothetical protein
MPRVASLDCYSKGLAAISLHPEADWRELDTGHLISAGGADLLFYLMSAMSTVNDNTTTPSIKTISSFIEEGSMLGMALEQQRRSGKGIETAISKQNKRRSGTKSSTKPKSKSSKKS